MTGSSVQQKGVRPFDTGRWGLRATAISYLVLMILLPLASILHEGLRGGPGGFWRQLSNPIAVSALRLTLTVAVITTLVNAVMGTLTAYVLVRFDFPGKKVFNGLVDMPFAIPTLVTGVMLVTLYGPQQVLGGWLASHDIRVIFASPGIVLALLLVTYPFVIRTVEPVLFEMQRDQEEAAFTLGASPTATFFRIVLPTISRAVLTGSLLTFARAIGEFGSVVVVAGNIPGRTLSAPVYIYQQIESDNAQGAAAVSVLLLTLSFVLILTVDWIQRRRVRTSGEDAR